MDGWIAEDGSDAVIICTLMDDVFAVHLDASGRTRVGSAWRFDHVTFVTCHHVVGRREKIRKGLYVNESFHTSVFFLKSENSTEYIEVHATRLIYGPIDLAVLEPVVPQPGPSLTIRDRHPDRGMVVFLEVYGRRVQCILDGMSMKVSCFHRLLFPAIPGMSGLPVTDEDRAVVGMVLSTSKGETRLLSFVEILHELIQRKRDPGPEARAFAEQDLLDFRDRLVRSRKR